MLHALDKPTRGKTAPHRLQALDQYVCHSEEALLRRADGLFENAVWVDVGFGEFPDTTLEAVTAFRTLAPRLCAVATEQAPHRIEQAQSLKAEGVRFTLDGFELSSVHEPIRLIRAMNVLREYAPKNIPEIHEGLGRRLLPGGVLLEGSCDKTGGLLTARVFRKTDTTLLDDGLLLFSRFEKGFAPLQFRDWLPQDLRRQGYATSRARYWLETWSDVWQSRRSGLQPAQAFLESARAWAAFEPAVVQDEFLWRHGFVRIQGGLK